MYDPYGSDDKWRYDRAPDHDPYYDQTQTQRQTQTQTQPQPQPQPQYDPYGSGQQYPEYQQYPQQPDNSAQQIRPYQQYPEYQQQHQPKAKGFNILILVVIVIIVLAVILPVAAVTFIWSSSSEGGSSKDNDYYVQENSYIKISATKKDKGTYYTVTISSVSGGDLPLSDMLFRLIDPDGATVYNLYITNSDPSKFTKGESDIYPLTKGSTVTDNQTSYAVNANSEFDDYEGCYIVLIDQDADGELTPGDTFHIYKDFDNDGTDNIGSKYRMKIMYGENIALEKQL